MMHIEPTTQDVMKLAAPRSSPIARLPDCARIAEKVEKTSGEPLPNARKVTPATFSLRPRSWAIVAKFGVKKSDALIPSVEKRKNNQIRSPMNINGLTPGEEQK
jgi:hypothetical protein